MHWQQLKILRRAHCPRMFITAFGMILCLPLLTGADEKTAIYSWRDAEGILHFADRPTDSYPSRRLTPPRRFGVVPQTYPTETETRAAEQPDPRQSGTTIPTLKASPSPSPSPNIRAEQPPDYKQICKNARKRLRQLTRLKRMRVKNTAGQDVFLPRTERQSLIDATEESIQSNCTKI